MGVEWGSSSEQGLQQRQADAASKPLPSPLGRVYDRTIPGGCSGLHGVHAALDMCILSIRVCAV